jgi:hypothetical protein
MNNQSNVALEHLELLGPGKHAACRFAELGGKRTSLV